MLGITPQCVRGADETHWHPQGDGPTTIGGEKGSRQGDRPALGLADSYIFFFYFFGSNRFFYIFTAIFRTTTHKQKISSMTIWILICFYGTTTTTVFRPNSTCLHKQIGFISN